MRRLIVVACLLALAACKNEKDPDRPAKLANLQATLHVDHVWSADVGGAKVPLRLGLALAVDGERVYAAGRRATLRPSSLPPVIKYGARKPRRRWAGRRKSGKASSSWVRVTAT